MVTWVRPIWGIGSQIGHRLDLESHVPRARALARHFCDLRQQRKSSAPYTYSWEKAAMGRAMVATWNVATALTWVVTFRFGGVDRVRGLKKRSCSPRAYRMAAAESITSVLAVGVEQKSSLQGLCHPQKRGNPAAIQRPRPTASRTLPRGNWWD